MLTGHSCILLLDINSTLICYGIHNTGKTAAASKLIFPVAFTTNTYALAGMITHTFGNGAAYFLYYDSLTAANVVLWIRSSSGTNLEEQTRYIAIGY